MAEILGERRPTPRRRVGYQDVWPHGGSIGYQLDECGLRPADIAAASREVLSAKAARS